MRQGGEGKCSGLHEASGGREERPKVGLGRFSGWEWRVGGEGKGGKRRRER